MRIKRPSRDERIVVTVTEQEKMKIAEIAQQDNRTICSYIRYRLRDILEGVNDDRE